MEGDEHFGPDTHRELQIDRSDDGEGESEDDDRGIDVMPLVEYPTSLIAERPPKRRHCERCGRDYPNRQRLRYCPECRKVGVSSELVLVTVNRLEWRGSVVVNGERLPRVWAVAAPELPRGGDEDAFLAIVEAGRQAGFKTKHIALANAYRMLKQITHTGGTNYERFIRAVPRWAGVSIHSENILRGSDGRTYERKRGFALFQEYDVISERDRARKTTPTRKRAPMVFGHVTLTDRFYELVRNSAELKALDFNFLKSLPDRVTRRLYRYLDKKRWWGGHFEMDAVKLCVKLGFDPASLKTMGLKRACAILRRAVDALVERGFLKRYGSTPFMKTGRGCKLRVDFTRPGAGGAAASGNPFGLNDEQLPLAGVLAQEIAEVCGDEERNARHYFKIAADAVRGGYERLVKQALSITKAKNVPAGEVTTMSGYFTGVLETLKKQGSATVPIDRAPASPAVRTSPEPMPQPKPTVSPTGARGSDDTPDPSVNMSVLLARWVREFVDRYGFDPSVEELRAAERRLAGHQEPRGVGQGSEEIPNPSPPPAGGSTGL